MTDEPPVLEATDLSRDFNGQWAVEDVSLSIRSGEILALLGPNGAGKSTLLKLFSGLLMPARGNVRLWGKASWPACSQLTRVATVFDQAAPPSSVQVREIFALKASVAQGFDHVLAKQLCDEHQIAIRSQWRSLSKGQRRWILLVSAIASPAELLLLDEPADGLDVEARRRFYGLIRHQANQTGRAVIVASHILGDVERVADDVGIITDGRLQLHSSLEELRDEIFEIEFSSGDDIDAIADAAEVISSKTSDDGALAVIRFRSPSVVDQSLPGEIGRRHLNLEEVYLAYSRGISTAPPAIVSL